jgi:MFS family permease
MAPERVQTIYLRLLFLETVAASLIWGINTLFLLDAGLDLTEAFIVNGAFSAGYVLFEVPTGVVADAAGRRVSYMLGGVTLLVSTLGYLWLWQAEAGLVAWIGVSLVMGLGFTFFSGAMGPVRRKRG